VRICRYVKDNGRELMKIRESGMPQEEEWINFFTPAKILKMLGLDGSIVDVADFGCGNGTFTIPAAKIIRGKIYAFDIEPEMIEVIKKKARDLNIDNVKAVLRDFIKEGTGLRDLSVDFVMLFNILHDVKPINLLQEAFRILRIGGRVGIIHWNFDASTPRGPPMDMRPKPNQCREWAESVGFIFEKQVDLKPYHYGIVLRKES
jgi:ubiquinone/menaquinone biosynthesis C-methylase UbiE